jgi:phenylalanyl-tRNA synthetase alpha chain
MGFEEMDTYRWVESSFWNFDSLFQGQQHPCRDMHDTFFLSAPEFAPPIADGAYFERVKAMHERGGGGSIGLRYQFSDEIARTNILRTHTTACSSRYLAGLADEFRRTGELRPRKFFSVDRVFRNETLDPTHLAEFHQVEGFVIDRGLSIADLMSYVKDFFARIGLTELEFKPAYNPYTEPSMEIFAVHPEKGIMEIGNSGIFRPEMLGPMGIPPEWSVVAWRFSLERPTMIEYRMNEIRKLEGPLVSLNLIRNLPIPRLSF